MGEKKDKQATPETAATGQQGLEAGAQYDLVKHPYDEDMAQQFYFADPEVGDVVRQARAQGIAWKTILGLLIPLVKDTALAALRKLIERAGGGTPTPPASTPPK